MVSHGLPYVGRVHQLRETAVAGHRKEVANRKSRPLQVRECCKSSLTIAKANSDSCASALNIRSGVFSLFLPKGTTTHFR